MPKSPPTPEEKTRLKAYRHAYYLSHRAKALRREKEKYAALSSEEKAARVRRQRMWAAENREHERARKRAWRQANIDKARESVRKHYERNPEKKRDHYLKSYDPAKHRARYHSDPAFKIMRLLRSRLRLLVKRGVAKKHAATMTLAGCTLDFLKQHLESRFAPGMTWENHGAGPGRWNIDHIRPIASYDLTRAEHQAECFHFSNLQPLWYEENAAKSFRIAA